MFFFFKGLRRIYQFFKKIQNSSQIEHKIGQIERIICTTQYSGVLKNKKNRIKQKTNFSFYVSDFNLFFVYTIQSISLSINKINIKQIFKNIFWL